MTRQVMSTFVVLFLVVLLLVVRIVDLTLALSDARAQNRVDAERAGLLLRIIKHAWVGRSASELDALSANLAATGVITGVEHPNVEIGELWFALDKNIVTDVGYLDGTVAVD